MGHQGISKMETRVISRLYGKFIPLLRDLLGSNLESIILVGSHGRGDPSVFFGRDRGISLSDIDILVISRTIPSPESLLKSYRRLRMVEKDIEPLNPFFHVGLKVRTRDEIPLSLSPRYISDLLTNSASLMGPPLKPWNSMPSRTANSILGHKRLWYNIIYSPMVHNRVVDGELIVVQLFYLGVKTLIELNYLGKKLRVAHRIHSTLEKHLRLFTSSYFRVRSVPPGRAVADSLEKPGEVYFEDALVDDTRLMGTCFEEIFTLFLKDLSSLLVKEVNCSSIVSTLIDMTLEIAKVMQNVEKVCQGEGHDHSAILTNMKIRQFRNSAAKIADYFCHNDVYEQRDHLVHYSNLLKADFV